MFSKKNNKRIIVALLSTTFVFNQGISTLSPRDENNSNILVVGNNKAITDIVKANQRSPYHKKTKEINEKITVSFTIPQEYSSDYKPKGSRYDDKTLKNLIKERIEIKGEDYIKKVFKKIKKALNKKSLSNEEKRIIYSTIIEAMTGGIKISATGYSSLEGGPDKNEELSRLRAEEESKRVEKILKEIFEKYNKAEEKIVVNKETSGEGIITKSVVVKRLIEDINKYLIEESKKERVTYYENKIINSIDYSKIKKQDHKELKRLHVVMNHIRNENLSLWRKLSENLSILRKVHMKIELNINTIINIITILNKIPEEKAILGKTIGFKERQNIKERMKEIKKEEYLKKEEWKNQKEFLRKNIPRQEGRKGTGGRFNKL